LISLKENSLLGEKEKRIIAMVLRKKHRISLLFVLLLGLGACGDGSGYSAYQSISKEGMASTPYVFDLSDSSFEEKPYNFYIRLRNDNSYAFTNIFLICTLKAGDEFVLQDTLEYAMAAPDGSWLGKGFTEVKESKLWWKEGVEIPSKKPLVIELSQAMRNNGEPLGVKALRGIVSVGVSIEAQE
jgi:gliding motility-associated lipoprotein GldH